jgi:hypothetical protein
MSKDLIKISLTEFMNFVNKSGAAKITVVASAKTNREEEYQIYKDYWLKLRESIKSIHREKLSKDFLYSIIDDVSYDKKANYEAAINGYCRFWGKHKISWTQPPRKTWSHKDIRIELNPDLGLIIKEKIYYIKLFIASKGVLDKRHADLILTLMEKELRDKVETNSIFGVLDVKRGKLFEYKNTDTKLLYLLESEAESFESLWHKL